MSLSEEILRAIKKESLYLINEDAIRLTEWADKAAELESRLRIVTKVCDESLADHKDTLVELDQKDDRIKELEAENKRLEDRLDRISKSGDWQVIQEIVEEVTG